MTSGLEMEWDYSDSKGRDGQKKKISKANERKGKVELSWVTFTQKNKDSTSLVIVICLFCCLGEYASKYLLCIFLCRLSPGGQNICVWTAVSGFVKINYFVLWKWTHHRRLCRCCGCYNTVIFSISMDHGLQADLKNASVTTSRPHWRSATSLPRIWKLSPLTKLSGASPVNRDYTRSRMIWLQLQMPGSSAGTRQQPQPAAVLSVQSVAGSVHPLLVFAATCGYIIVLRPESTASSSTSTDNCKQASKYTTVVFSYLLAIHATDVFSAIQWCGSCTVTHSIHSAMHSSLNASVNGPR